MAERGAHLTYTTLSKPSIFELVAQESLSSTIQPAFRRIAEFLAHYNPERFEWLFKWYDEVYVALSSLLQHHYLSHYGGSLSEVFYGLRRVSLTNSTEVPLRQRGQLLSLFQLILVPYMYHKLEKLVNDLRYEEEVGMLSRSRGEKLALKLFLRAYYCFHMTYEASKLVSYVLYMSGRARSHSPLLRYIGLALRYSEEDDLQSQWESLTERWFSPKKIGQGILRVLEVGAFCLQFLQWSQGADHSIDFTALPVPSAPPLHSRRNSIKGKCPLCHNAWHIETLLPVSGYVFCYRCIMHYLQKNNKCPVTDYPASGQDLVRLYK